MKFIQENFIKIKKEKSFAKRITKYFEISFVGLFKFNIKALLRKVKIKA